MKKKLALIGLTSLLAVSSAMTVFAGQWKQDSIGWWWQEDDGSYPTNCWKWLDGNNDNIAECYYFDSVGYMLANTTTPDGYTVNENGAWTIEGTVQIRQLQNSETAELQEETSKLSKLDSILSAYTESDESYQAYVDAVYLLSSTCDELGVSTEVRSEYSEKLFAIRHRYLSSEIYKGHSVARWLVSGYTVEEAKKHIDDIIAYAEGIKKLGVTMKPEDTQGWN